MDENQVPTDDTRDYDAEEKDKRMEQNEFHVEQLKYSIISDLHALDGRIGREQCRAWLKANFVDLPF